MNKKTTELFFKMESNRKNLFQFLSEYDSDKFNEMPNGVWSVNQNIQHLLLSEKGTVAYMSKKILAADALDSTGLKNKWNWFMLKAAFHVPFKYKAPGIVKPEKEEFVYQNLMRDWEVTRHKLQEFINAYPEKYQNKNIFKHPMAGRANLNMALDFLDFHSARHIKQIKRTIRNT